MTEPLAGWEKVRLGAVLKVRYGKALPAVARSATANYPVIGSAGRMAAVATPLVDFPVIVIGRKGNVGAVHLESDGCWPIDTTYFVEIPDYLNARFLKHQLVALEMSRLDSSTATPSLRRQDLERQWLLIPSMHEQDLIVERLEDHLSRLDAANRQLASGLGRLQGLRRAVWSRAFVDCGVAKPVPLPQVVTIANGQTPKGILAKLSPSPVEDSVPYYKVGDMNAGDGRYMSDARFHVTRSDASSLGLHIRPPGTVLIPKRGGAIATNKKRILHDPGAIDLNTMGLVANGSLEPEYLWHWLIGIDLALLADGSNVPQINAPQIRQLSIPLPSRPEQRVVVNQLNQEYADIDRMTTAIRITKQREVGLRRAVLAAAVSGRLTAHTSDLDPTKGLVDA